MMSEQKERPIIFNGDMVRAILDGRKTQTRRPCRDQTPCKYAFEKDMPTWPDGELYTGWTKDIAGLAIKIPTKSPYGEAGDRLWVRETWGLKTGSQNDHSSRVSYRAGGDKLVYWQDGDRIPEKYGYSLEPDKWRPSIHMPRWASRITLEVVDIRVERIQEIDGADCYREGKREPNPVEKFHGSWDSIYAAKGTGWDANPWVWVVEFKRLEAE
jgi:hypothetical protein